MVRFKVLDGIVLNDSELLEIHGGNGETKLCGNNCGNNCGGSCGDNCGNSCGAEVTPPSPPPNIGGNCTIVVKPN